MLLAPPFGADDGDDGEDGGGWTVDIMRPTNSTLTSTITHISAPIPIKM